MKFILGTKLGMTQVFRDDGTVVPVTRVKSGPCVITQVKNEKKDGVNSVQVGFGEQKKFRQNKAMQGHLKDLAVVRFLRDFKSDKEHELKRGDEFTVNIFEKGEKVQVVGNTKGKGFQGVVKRHGFHGSPASHGHKDQLRMPGSIGATDAARVFKGKRMAGRMGDSRITIKNLEIVEIKPEENELLIKGAIPGARGGLLLISTDKGKMEIVDKNSVLDLDEEKKEIEVSDSETKDVKVEEEISNDDSTVNNNDVDKINENGQKEDKVKEDKVKEENKIEEPKNEDEVKEELEK